MNVPFLDLRAPYRELRVEMDRAHRRVMASGRYLFGGELEKFEAEFAGHCGTRRAVGMANGLQALEAILHALEIGPGDEVIVPSHTFIATWLAVSAVGATIVPVEPDEETYNIDSQGVAEALSRRTKAVIAVHLYGQPADMDGIRAALGRRSIPIIEDAAQAHGARYKGRPVGSLGTAAAFSFYPAKNLGAMGDGGAVVTQDPRLADRVRAFANYGSSQKGVHRFRGTNSRLDELQAAFLRVKLRHLERWNRRRREVARAYQRSLEILSPALTLPQVPKWADPVWHLFAVRTPRREEVRRRLTRAGVETLVHYPIPPHRQEAYRDGGWVRKPLSRAERIAREVLSLPMGPHLTEREVAYTIAAVKRGLSPR